MINGSCFKTASVQSHNIEIVILFDSVTLYSDRYIVKIICNDCYILITSIVIMPKH